MVIGSSNMKWAIEKLTSVGHGGLLARTGRLWFVYAGIERNSPAGRSIESIHELVISIHEPGQVVKNIPVQ